MKRIVWAILAMTAATAWAGWRNDLTGERAATPPEWLVIDGAVVYNAPAEAYAAAGWREDTAAELAAEAQAAAEAAAQEQAARIGQLAAQFGPMVGALQVFLSQVGYSIPVEPATVTGDLLTRAIAGTITAEQREAKANIADLYIYLQAAGLSNSDIAAVWEAIKP